jgi:lipoprotein NlpD
VGAASARAASTPLDRSRRRRAWLCAILATSQIACIHGSRAGSSSAPLVPQAPQAGRTHVVQAGENLYRIALQENVSVEAIEAENGIDDPTQLAVGQTLFIPGNATKPVGTPTIASLAPAVIDAPRRDGSGNPRLLWPVRGVIFSTFGHRGDEHHDGVDLAAPEGTPIVAAADGTVLFVGEQRGYGDIVIVEHPGDLVTVYAHNRENLVETGEHVQRGQTIAKVGRTGNATGPHVHFEVRVGTRPQDPLEFLR